MKPIEDFLAEHKYAESTKETYRRVLSQAIELDLQSITSAGLLKFVEKDKWGSSQRHVALTACKTFIRWNFGDTHPALATRVKRGKSKARRAMSPQKAIKLLEHFQGETIKGCRDLTIAMLMLDTGFRVHEVAGIKISNISFEPIFLPGLKSPVYAMSTIVKGGDSGIGIFSEDTMMEIKTWLCWRETQDVGHDALFTSTINGEPLTVEGLKTIVRKWGIACDFKLSAHDFRSSFATLATIYGAPSRTGQKAGRWHRIEMFEHYTETLEQAAIAPYLPITNLLRGGMNAQQ